MSPSPVAGARQARDHGERREGETAPCVPMCPMCPHVSPCFFPPFSALPCAHYDLHTKSASVLTKLFLYIGLMSTCRAQSCLSSLSSCTRAPERTAFIIRSEDSIIYLGAKHICISASQAPKFHRAGLDWARAQNRFFTASCPVTGEIVHRKIREGRGCRSFPFRLLHST